MKNAEKYAPHISRILANTVGGVCIQFAKDTDYYGGFDCSTCPLKGVCNDAKKLEAFLKQEASSDD